MILASKHKIQLKKGENVLMVTLGYGILVTVVDLRVLVTLFYSMELW